VTDRTVGIIGLGIMGGAIARNLIERGWAGSPLGTSPTHSSTADMSFSPSLDDASPAGSSSAVGDVREALAGLGYGSEEIREALREVDASEHAELLLRDALKVLGARRA
jgi:3-hydroxyacyl-CoA dehydrogenase